MTVPIDIDRFEEQAGFDGEETQTERILRFLASNDDQAFRRSEIGEATGIDPNAVNSVLARLKERDLVRHKQPYWAIGEYERLREATGLSQSVRALNQQLGREDMDEWRKAAADDSAGGGDEPDTRDSEKRE